MHQPTAPGGADEAAEADPESSSCTARNRKLGLDQDGLRRPPAMSCSTRTPTCPSTWTSWSRPAGGDAPLRGGPRQRLPPRPHRRGYVRSFYSTIYNVLVRCCSACGATDFAFKLCRRSVLDHMTLVSEGPSSTPSWSSGPTSWASTSSSSVSTTSRTRGVSTLSLPGGDRHHPAGDVGPPARSCVPGRDGWAQALRGGWPGPVGTMGRWPGSGSPAPGREPTDRSGAATCHLSTPPPCADGRRRSWPWWRSRGSPAGGDRAVA